jgi:hypothetical protein
VDVGSVDPSVRHIGKDDESALAATAAPFHPPLDARFMEHRYLGPVPTVPLARCRWKAFLSHHHAAAGGFVKALEAELKRRGAPLWMMWTDMTEVATEENMREGMELSECVILFLTTSMLERHWCQKEIRWALECRKPVLLVYRTDPREGHGNADFGFYVDQIKRTFPSQHVAEHDHEWLLKGVAVPYDQRDGYDVVMVQDILKQMPGAQVDVQVAVALADPSVRHLGEVGEAVPEDQCKLAAYISHHQGVASRQVLWLGERMEKKLKAQGKRLTKVRIDKTERATDEGIRDGVRGCNNFIVLTAAAHSVALLPRDSHGAQVPKERDPRVRDRRAARRRCPNLRRLLHAGAPEGVP